MIKLKEIRQSKELSQNKLAQLAGMHPSTVSSIERGYLVAYPSQREKLAAALDCENTPELFREI